MVKHDRIDSFIEELHKSTPSHDVASYGIWGRITLIQERHLSIVSQTLKPLGLTFNEYQIIGILYLSGKPYEMNPSQLIQRKVMSSGGITNLLAKMETAGLITREPSKEDRRSVIVRLTEKGIRLSKASLVGNVEQKLLVGMTEDEVDVLNILLRKALHVLETGPFGKAGD